MANYSLGIKPFPDVENGHVFTMDNFMQINPHTKIFEGISGLKFINCNLTNCDVPADAELIGCSLGHYEWCSNVHPKWVTKGLTECPENCKHVIDVDNVTIDGIVVGVTYHYSDTRIE